MKMFGWKSFFWWILCFVVVSSEWFARGARGDRSLRSLKIRAVNLFPESFDWDPVHDRFLLGSASAGTISALSVDDGSISEFVRDEEFAGKVGIAGVKVDRRRNRVIAAVQDFHVVNYSGVAAYDLDTKKRLYFARLDGVGVAQGERTCANDVAIDFEGNVYVTNCISNFLWKVTKEGTPSVFMKHDSFTTQPTVVDKSTAWCGLNGIVYEPRKYLLVSQTNSGAIFRVGVEDQSVHVVVMKEKPPGADGMALREDGTLVVISSEKAWLLGSASNWMAANVVDTVPLNVSDHVTTVALRKGSSFVLHSHLPEMFAKQTREAFEVNEIAFPAEASDNDPVWLIVLIVVVVVAVSLWRFQMGHFYEQHRRKRA